jgi:hypothetical protein
MGKRTSKTKTVTENTFAPWAQNFAQSNIGFADALTSGVMNRYGGSAPDSFVAPFSEDTQGAFSMARAFTGGSTPGDIRKLATGELAGSVRGAIKGMGELANRAAPSFAPYQALTGDEIATQTFGGASVGDVGDVSARQGAEYMNAYLNPYLRDVVDTSLADYDVGVDRQAAQNRARRDAASAFGDRAALADAVFSADSSRGRGSLASGLRSQAFNTAASFGMQDSDRILEAERVNQQVALQRALENARLQQAAAEANARMAQEAAFKNADIRNQFTLTNDQRLRDLEMQNFNAGVTNDQFKLGALNAQASAAQGQQTTQADLLAAADAAEQRRIAALTAVGQANDERNQAVLSEPLELLKLRAQLLAQTPYPTTTTETGTRKMSGIDALMGVGKAFGDFSSFWNAGLLQVPKTPGKPQ